jgi:hypothetical protein
MLELVDGVPTVSAGLSKHVSERSWGKSLGVLNSMTICGEVVCPLVFVVAPLSEEYDDKGTEGGHCGDDPYGVTLKGPGR